MEIGKLDKGLVTHELAQLLSASSASGLQWEHASHESAKQLLRDILFGAQDSKCAYCRRFIQDETGKRQIDHILPKRANGKAERWTSSSQKHRRSTAGYSGFMFHGLNLILTCTRCNNKKGTYDPRRNRGVDVGIDYSLDEAYYEWVHPYVHNYADHIQLLAGLIYNAVDESENGKAVISVCKLDQVAAVERKALERKIKNAVSVNKAFVALMDRFDSEGWDFLVQIVHEKFPDETIERVREIGEPLRAAAARL